MERDTTTVESTIKAAQRQSAITMLLQRCVKKCSCSRHSILQPAITKFRNDNDDDDDDDDAEMMVMMVGNDMTVTEGQHGQRLLQNFTWFLNHFPHDCE
jgi:hypothetical protein